jgi:hypothetical protein
MAVFALTPAWAVDSPPPAGPRLAAVLAEARPAAASVLVASLGQRPQGSPASARGASIELPPLFARAPAVQGRRFSTVIVASPLSWMSAAPFSTPLWQPLLPPLLVPLSVKWLTATEHLADWLATPSGQSAATSETQAESDPAERERTLRWLVRHKPRSVLESRRASADPTGSRALERLMPWLPDVAATVEYVASPQSDGTGSAARLMRLKGQFPSGGRWDVGGLLYQSDTPRWRTVTEAVVVPFTNHEITLTTAWANRFFVVDSLRSPDEPPEQALEGVLVARDRWRLIKPLALSVGGRYSYVGFVANAHHFDPLVALEWTPGRGTAVRASMSSRTLVPGGGSLALSLFDPIVPASRDVPLAHSFRTELAAERVKGATRLTARAFREEISNPFVNVLMGPFDVEARTIPLGARMVIRGAGASISHRLGKVVEGSLSYSLGHAHRPLGVGAEPAGAGEAAFLVPEGIYHDFVGRLSTSIEPTDTRVSAFSRLVATKSGSRFRYEVQLQQVLPFVERPTGTLWTLVVAMRNLPWEPQEDDALSGIAEANPPRRVLGGVSVQF